MKTKPTTLKQQLSKDMKKQGHVTKKKPSNKKLSSEEALAETPKKGTYREPNSKKLSSETSLQKSHKLVHLKEFSQFIIESSEPIKEQIIEVLGQNHKHPIQFNAVNSHSEVYGLYTYKGGIYVFKEGQDIDFDDLDTKEQKKVLALVLSKDWKVNKSLQ